MLYFHLQPFGKRVGYGSAHAVQTARILIVSLPEFSARMQLREYQLNAGNLFFRVNIGGNTSAVIFHGGAAVFVQNHFDFIGVPVGGFVYRVIHDFPKNMMKPFYARGTDVHTGAHTHRVQPFEHFEIFRAVRIFFLFFFFFVFCHFVRSIPLRVIFRPRTTEAE